MVSFRMIRSSDIFGITLCIRILCIGSEYI